jgi:2-aminoadipate transaminase
MEVLKIDGGTSIFGSYVAADWLPKHLPEHVGQLRSLYQFRKESMVSALERYMPAGTEWTNPDGGYFVWLTLPESVNATTLLPQARERGVEYLPGSTCFPDSGHDNRIRLSFSFTNEQQINDGIRILADIVKGEMLEQG